MAPTIAEWLQERAAERNRRLTSRLAAIQGMRELPDREEIDVGSARETRGAILFADLVESTGLAHRYARQPEKMLATLNLLVPTLMDAARCYDGEFEKNTGDGILAYFGMGAAHSDEHAAVCAVAAAQAMLWATANIVNPHLGARKLENVKITIGADLGDVLLARIGLQRVSNGTPMVAVGLVANRAAKIQDSAVPGQARIGEDLYKVLPRDRKRQFRQILVTLRGPAFHVPKSAVEMELDQSAARREAEQVNILPSRYVGLLPVSYVPSAPAIPSYVSPMRPYRVYLLRTPLK